MKKIIAAAALAITATAAHAEYTASMNVVLGESWARTAETATMENCLNSQGKIWSGMRRGYCNQYVPQVQAYYRGELVFQEQIISAARQLGAEERLREAQAQGMNCALRQDGNGRPFVLCRDSVGTFRY